MRAPDVVELVPSSLWALSYNPAMGGVLAYTPSRRWELRPTRPSNSWWIVRMLIRVSGYRPGRTKLHAALYARRGLDKRLKQPYNCMLDPCVYMLSVCGWGDVWPSHWRINSGEQISNIYW